MKIHKEQLISYLLNTPNCTKHFMKSALCLGYGPPSVMSLRVLGATKLRFGENYHSSLLQSLLWTNSCRHRKLDHVSSAVPRALDRSSMPPKNVNHKGDNKFLKGAAGASLVMACALSIISCSCKMNPPAMAGPRQIYQKAPPVTMAPMYPIGGKAALKSLLDVSAALASNEIEPPLRLNLEMLPPRPSKEEVDAIKMEAVRLMKTGNSDEALELLNMACKKYKNDSELAYNMEMALVEILICLGKFEEASECHCLHDDYSLPSDVRLYLYKAIIYTMLNRDDEARIWWKAFRKTIGEGINPIDFD